MASLATALHLDAVLHPGRHHAGSRSRAGYRVSGRHFDKLPGSAYLLITGGYAVMMLSFAILFVTGLESGLSVLTGMLIMAMCFGIPRIVTLIGSRHHHDPFGRLAEWRVPRRTAMRDFLDGEMDTASGPLSGWSALIHVGMLPVGLACAAIGIGIVFASMPG
ncbi:hypothetical protein [Ferrovibrio xuzhouensis]|uniref:Uncharacterized protein n=1 Tax=Ferrovibrio xuzhouensis TaxID=1576914 RepID=A0ABV7VG02_9PROT